VKIPARLRVVIVCGLALTVTSGGCARGRAAYRPSERPPATRVDPVTETIHGVPLTDDYRWLEGASSPDGSNPGQMTPEVSVWTDAQLRYTRTVLDGVPGRDKVEARMSQLLDLGDLSVPMMSGNRYFFWLRNPGDPLPTVYVREGALGSDRALIRPADLAPTGPTGVRWMVPSPDGALLAFGTYRARDADSALRVLDVATGTPLPLEIRGSPRAVHWLPDSTGFIYQRLANPADPTSNVILFHQLGRDPKDDRLLHRQYMRAENPILAATEGPFATLSRDGRWLVAGYWTSAASNDLWLVNFDDLRSTGRAAPRMVTIGGPGRASATVIGETLFVQTTKGAPNGRVVAVDVASPGEARWRDVVPERADATIEHVAFGRGLIAVTFMKQASNVTEIFDLSGQSIGTLAQPGIGTTLLGASDDRTEAFLSFQSFNQPPTIIRVDLQRPTVSGVPWKMSAAPVNPDSVGVELVRYRSNDGTEVSMFVVRRKDLTLNGSLPTLIVANGAFGVRMVPSFTADQVHWLESGGVLAVPHVRGGGEYGPAWRAAGARDRKQASFDDAVAAAEWLIANRYTQPDRLAIYGAAGGGLLAGGVLTSRPDLFRAAVLLSPLLDMIRYDRFLPASSWTPEFGTASDPTAFGWLRGYSPYHRVTRGTRYPAVLLTGSETMAGFHALHARKMTARLQAATSADPGERPVLLRIEKAGGLEAPAARALEALVDQWLFLMWQLGMN
jgi:prolyl oligopeptidase